jgi:glc operon protein GlcG
MKTRLLTLCLALVVSVLTLAPGGAAAQAPAAAPPPPPAYGAPIAIEVARKAAASAIAEGKKNGWFVAVAIVDPAGDLVFFERMDNTQSGSIVVAQAKARTAAQFKRPTKAFEDGLAAGRQAILGLPGAIPVEGGIPLIIDGKVVGAIGVSGATSAQDTVCAQAGVDVIKAPARK